MSVQHILKVLLIRWKIILAFTTVGLGIALAYALLTPPVYKATAQVVAGVRAPETIGPQSGVNEQLTSDYLLTQEDILKSPRVALQVVDATGLTTEANIGARFGWTPERGPLPNFIAKQIGNGLAIESSAVNSRVMEISFWSGDPNFSARMANAFADAFIDVNIQLHADPARRTVQSYTDQLNDLAKQLSTAQAQLAEKERSLGIVASKGESDPDSLRLGALSSQLANAQAAAAISAAHSGNALPDTMSSPVVQGLQSEISKLEGQRQLQATTAGPNNPEYKMLVAQIAETRRQLSIQEALVRQTTAAASSQARSAEAKLNGAVAEQRRRVIAARAVQNEVSVIEQDVANLRASYEQIAARRAQLQILDNTGQTNISLLSPAIADSKPVAPRRFIITVTGLCMGIALGLIVAIGIEIADRRIRSSQQLEFWLGIPDLGSVRLAPAAQRRRLLPGPVAGLLSYRRGD